MASELCELDCSSCYLVARFNVNVPALAVGTGFRMSSENRTDKPADENWYQNVWKVVSEIPPGHVLTYGEVARLSGMPRAARRVSQALRRAPRGVNLPWHRVINAQGRISFPEDSDAWQKQKNMLEEEGVVFLEGKVDLDRFGYRGAVDRLLWGDDGQ
jgi:methylated-DNA-protein-cysteine methyltransferase-like protein